MTLPTEDKIRRYLLRYSEFNNLPPWAELEPGSFLYAVKEVWEKEQDRDGRRGHMSETRIATEISNIIGKKFTRNQYQSLFGAGRKEQKSRPSIAREIAEAFLLVAFNNWSFNHTDNSNASSNGFKSILHEYNVDLPNIINDICNIMYIPGAQIRCVPSEGLGPVGFYKQCRKNESSVIIATDHEHIIMNDPGVGYIDWTKNAQTMFQDIDWDTSKLMHIWVIKEPLISTDPRSVAGLHDIGILRTAFIVARSMCLIRPSFPSWEKLSRKCIVVILLHKNNNKYRDQPFLYNEEEENPIETDFIFPKDVPWQWQSKGDEKLSRSDLNFITTVNENSEEDIEVKYNIYPHKENHRLPPVVSKMSPSKESDRSFANMYLACKYYVEFRKSGRTNALLKACRGHGWKFMTADEFLDLKIP